MPGRPPQYYKPRTVIDASPGGAIETIVCTYTGIDTVDADSTVILTTQVNLVIGTSGTALRIRIRQTSISGAVVGDTGAITGGVAAGNVMSQDVIGVDNPGAVASFVYVATVQVTGGAAASTLSAVSIIPVVF